MNPGTRAYLRGLGEEFGESTNSIRLELNRLEEASMLVGEHEGNKKYYTVNAKHPLYKEMSGIVRKYMGLDVLVDQVVEKLGGVEHVYLTGALAEGKNEKAIEMAFIGQLNQKFLMQLIEKAEKLLNKKIDYSIFSSVDEFALQIQDQPNILLWSTKE